MNEIKNEDQFKGPDNRYEKIFYLEKDIIDVIEMSKKSKQREIPYEKLKKFYLHINDDIIVPFNDRYKNFKSLYEEKKCNLKIYRKKIYKFQKYIILFNLLFCLLYWAGTSPELPNFTIDWSNVDTYCYINANKETNDLIAIPTDNPIEQQKKIEPGDGISNSCKKAKIKVLKTQPIILFGFPIKGITQIELVIGFLLFITTLRLCLTWIKTKEYINFFHKNSKIFYIIYIEKKIMSNIFELFKCMIEINGCDNKYIYLKNKYKFMINYIEKDEEERETIAQLIERKFTSSFCLLSIIIVFAIICKPIIDAYNLDLLANIENFEFKKIIITTFICMILFFITLVIELFSNIHIIYTLLIFKFKLVKIKNRVFSLK